MSTSDSESNEAGFTAKPWKVRMVASVLFSSDLIFDRASSSSYAILKTMVFLLARAACSNQLRWMEATKHARERELAYQF